MRLSHNQVYEQDDKIVQDTKNYELKSTAFPKPKTLWLRGTNWLPNTFNSQWFDQR